MTQLWIINQYAAHDAESGGARHHNLSRHLVSLGFDVTIFCGGNRALPQSDDGVRFVRYRVVSHSSNGIRRLLGMLLFALRILILAVHRPSPRPAVVLGSSPHPFAAGAAALVARRFGARFVLEVRDVWPASLVEVAGVSRRHPLVRLLAGVEKWLYRRAELVISPLSRLNARISEVVGSQAPPFLHVSNGVDPSRFLPAHDGPTDPFTITYTGAEGPPNGLMWLLEAAKLLLDDPSGVAFRVELYGDGAQRSELEQRARAEKIANVTFHDPVPRSEIPSILAAANLLVLPGNRTSLYRYGFSPNKLFEYMAAAKPVVSAIEAPDHPVINGRCGINATPGNPGALAAAIRAIALASVEEREAMGARGRAFVIEHATYEALAEQLAMGLKQINASG